MPVHETIFPTIRGAPILANVERVLQPVTDFIRGNPIVSTAAIGVGTTGLIAGAAIIRKSRKRKKAAKRKKTSRKRAAPRRKGRKRTKAQIKKIRLKNLKKARAARKSRKRHVRGRSHASPRHRGHKKVMFTTKDGKRVSFLVKKNKRRKR